MDGDSLAQCFVNRFAEGIIEMGFPTQNQREVIQVLRFINSEKKRLAFFLVKISDLFLDRLEHPGFAAF